MSENFRHPWNDAEVHKRYHALLVRNIRSDAARLQYVYDRLPWWRKILKRRPEHPFVYSGYTVLPCCGAAVRDGESELG